VPGRATYSDDKYTDEGNHNIGTAFCAFTIEHGKDPGGYTGLHATDTTNGALDITGTIEGINVRRGKLASHSSILCQEATEETVKLHLDINVTGKNALGQATAISLSH
jgi:hypothetical protein